MPETQYGSSECCFRMPFSFIRDVAAKTVITNKEVCGTWPLETALIIFNVHPCHADGCLASRQAVPGSVSRQIKSFRSPALALHDHHLPQSQVERQLLFAFSSSTSPKNVQVR